MDPITHLVVSISLTALSGTPSPDHSVYTAAALGSLVPDLDFILRIKGEIFYLNQHRGASHSAFGSILISGLLALFLSAIYPQTAWSTIFFWALVGTGSHMMLDFFNPHGIQFLWPLKRKRYHYSLLNGIDPILVLISLLIICHNIFYFLPVHYLGITYLLYLFWRWAMAKSAYRLIKNRLGKKGEITNIITMPSLFSLWSWDFLVVGDKKIIAGDVRCFARSFRIATTLNKHNETIVSRVLDDYIGKLFLDFTPYVHICLKRVNQKIILEFIDLRYRINDKFLHSAVVVFNEKEELEKAVFYPFSKNRGITLVDSAGAARI